MKFILILCSFLACTFSAYAERSAASDYDSLSRLSSEELMEQGRHYFEERKGGQALSRFLIVAERYRENESREQMELSVRALNNIGCVYKYIYYDYPSAYDYLSRAYELGEEIGYDSFMPVILVNMGDLLSDYGMAYNSDIFLSEANSLFYECFKKAFSNRNWELMTTAFFNLSNLNYDINLKDYEELFSKNIPSDTPDLEFVRLQFHGIELMQEGKYPEARAEFARQIDHISTPWEANRDTIASYINIAETYKRELDYRQAAEVLSRALTVSDNAGLIDMSANIAGQLADCYKHTGDTLEWQHYHSLYLERKEQLNNARLSNISELKYISELRKEEEKAQEIAVRNRFFRYMIIALVIVLLTIATASSIIWRNNHRLKIRNKSLFDTYQQLLKSETKPAEDKYGHSNLNDSKRIALLENIQAIMDNPDIITRQDFTSKQLAELVNSNTTYVSQVINENFNISFSTMLGNSRVRLVCRRLTETNLYDNLTIEGIAHNVGFKSRTAFLNAFKREVGLTPSEYIKIANARRQEAINEA